MCKSDSRATGEEDILAGGMGDHEEPQVVYIDGVGEVSPVALAFFFFLVLVSPCLYECCRPQSAEEAAAAEAAERLESALEAAKRKLGAEPPRRATADEAEDEADATAEDEYRAALRQRAQAMIDAAAAKEAGPTETTTVDAAADAAADDIKEKKRR